MSLAAVGAAAIGVWEEVVALLPNKNGGLEEMPAKKS